MHVLYTVCCVSKHLQGSREKKIRENLIEFELTHSLSTQVQCNCGKSFASEIFNFIFFSSYIKQHNIHKLLDKQYKTETETETYFSIYDESQIERMR